MASSDSPASGKPDLPAEIYTALVATLFGTVGSFFSGILGGLLVPAISYARTGNPIFLTCTVGIVALSLFRLAVLLMRRRAGENLDVTEVRRWELLYGLGGIGFMAAVGGTAALLFIHTHEHLTRLYGVVITMGCIGALAGRNAGRPWIVYGQVMGLCLPLTLVLLLEFDPWHWGVAAILVLVMISVKSTTRFLNQILVSALMNGREATVHTCAMGAWRVRG